MVRQVLDEKEEDKALETIIINATGPSRVYSQLQGNNSTRTDLPKAEAE